MLKTMDVVELNAVMTGVCRRNTRVYLIIEMHPLKPPALKYFYHHAMEAEREGGAYGQGSQALCVSLLI